MFDIETEWVVDAARESVGAQKIPLMKSCIFKHPSGFKWKFSVSVHGADPNKFTMTCKQLDIECRSLGVHDGWESAEKLALRIVSSLLKHMFDAAQTAYINFENEAAKIKFEKTIEALRTLDSGNYVKDNKGRSGWIIEIVECNPKCPATEPGTVEVWFESDDTSETFPFWEWPDHLEVTEDPWGTKKTKVETSLTWVDDS